MCFHVSTLCQPILSARGVGQASEMPHGTCVRNTDSSQYFCTRCRETLPGAAFARARTGRPYATCNTCRDRQRLRAVRVIAGAGRNTWTRNVAGSQVEPRMLNPGEPLGWLPINGMESVEPHDLGRMDTVCTFCDAKHWLSERLAVSSCSL
jgi:hypothetical protein